MGVFVSRAVNSVSKQSLLRSATFLLVAGILLFVRPYAGVRHDGVLYLGQALLASGLPALRADPFFQFGSQDQFSIISPILLAMYDLVGVAKSQILIIIFSRLLVFFAIWQVLRSIREELRWVSLLLLAVLPHVYSGFGVFSSFESFVTARTFAEPLAILSIWMTIERKFLLLWLCLGLTFLFHPLIGLSVGVIVSIYLMLEDRRWFWLIGLVTLSLLLVAWIGVEPFGGLFRRYDPTWWSVVERANPFVLLSAWSLMDWQRVGFDLLVLFSVRYSLDPALNRLCLSIGVGSILMLIISLLGVDFAHGILATQLQLWRILCFVHLFAIVLAPVLVFSAWRLPRFGKVLAIMIFGALLASTYDWSTGWLFIVLSVLGLMVSRSSWPISPFISRLSLVSAFVAIVALSLVIVEREIASIRLQGYAYDSLTITRIIASSPLVPLIILLGLFRPWRDMAAVRWLVISFISVFFVFAATQWDQRSVWIRHIEEGLGSDHPFSEIIPVDAQVYWMLEPAAVWMLLKRASYQSPHQAAGSLFNRRTALEMERRRAVVDVIETQHRVCQLYEQLNARKVDDCWPTLQAVEKVCRSDGGPDFMVLHRDVGRGRVAAWTFAAGTSGSTTWYLHDCARVR